MDAVTPRLLVITDIFGVGPGLSALTEKLAPHYQVEVLDPYKGKAKDFADEGEAYHAFIEEMGHQEYFEQLKCRLLQLDSQVYLVGFSAGCGALWRASADEDCAPAIKGALGFYGNPVREWTHLLPKVPVSLVYPEREAHFSVPELVTELSGTQNLNLEVWRQQHGFMNAQSHGFCPVGLEKGIARIKALN